MAQVFLLHGQNSVSLDDRQHQLLSELDSTGVGTAQVDLASATLDVVANACLAAPFFGAGRAVLLRNLAATFGRKNARQSASIEWKDIQELLERSPDSTSIVLRADENLPANSVVIKAAKSNSWKVDHFPMQRGEELARWVAERGSRSGITFSRDAAMLLLSRLYPTSWRQESRFDNTVLDARLIATEIEKLACATDDGAISEALVAEMVEDRSGSTAFRLNDLVYSGQPDLALVELEQVLSSGDEPERILAQFASESAGFAAARTMPEFDPASVSRASGVSEGRLKMLRQKPASRSEDGLHAASERLRRAEWLVKTGRAPRGESVIVATAAELSEAFRRHRG